MKTHQLATAISLILANATYASTSDDKTEEVRVWGTQVESSSVYLGTQDISVKQADHLSDILRSVPGVDIGGTHSVNTRINIRGLDDRDLAIYIDRVLQTNYLYHHMGNLLINPDILKSAKIELGTNSVAYGGLGGAISFETKDAQDLLRDDASFGGRIYGGYHSNAQQSASLTLYGKADEAFDYLVYANVTDRDNFEDGGGQETVGSDGTTTDLLLKGGINVSSNQRIELNAEFYYDRGDYGQRPDMGYQAADGLSGSLEIPLFDTEYDRETFNIGYEGEFGSTNINANAYINSMRLYRDESDGIVHPFGFVIPSTEKEVTAENFGLAILASTELGINNLTYGLEHFAQSFDFDLNSSTVENQKQDSNTLAMFVEDRISITKAFALTPGVRLNQYTMEIEETGFDESWDDTSFALAADWRVNEALELLGSYTELFKGPELAEPFQGTGGVLVPNEELEPETGENIEVGLRYSNTLKGDATFNFGFNLYQTTIDDYITQQDVPDSSGNEYYVNAGKAVIDGFETSINYVVDQWDILLTYAHSDLEEKDLEVNDTTESLREVGDSISLDVSAKFSEQVSANYNVLTILDQQRAFGGDEKPGYTVHNVSIVYKPSHIQGLTFIAGADNLLDEEYTSHASREGVAPFTTPPTILNDVEPGRNVKVSAAYEF